MTIGSRLDEAMKDRIPQWSQAELHRVTGVPQPTISRILGDRHTPETDTLLPLATALGYRFEYLLSGDLPKKPFGMPDIPPLTSRELETRKGAIGGDNFEPATTLRTKEYPVISWVQAGIWSEISGELLPGEAQEWRQSPKDLGPNGYMLRVNGDSMSNPTGPYSFPAGMLLHVNPDLNPSPGQFVIVRRNETEATFKRLVHIDGILFLEAINPAWPTRYIELKEDDACCGVVVDASFNNLP